MSSADPTSGILELLKDPALSPARFSECLQEASQIGVPQKEIEGIISELAEARARVDDSARIGIP